MGLRDKIKTAAGFFVKNAAKVLWEIVKGFLLVAGDAHRFLKKRIGARVWVVYLVVIVLFGIFNDVARTILLQFAYSLASAVIVFLVFALIIFFLIRALFFAKR
ncbi:MAG: hypothetical protein A3B96_03635 [Candidatus Spechtbacteria bacterium RIFCSPHIGHO2_02_FULL_43_15b]|uniref:Uncharacterized protein n=1 Tax=Candidatus Spechtbacteria bacterium RIFCSPHIGHO2_01_FULL_43_30 TaxID=1802158 RepID=A0A1G2H835_9BACT|nr:MAG: hypothetical protein A2827_03155 [Candidatus Spechtbacteria bacterium RIFCSPHIGHO2_01_FULL_43_30]OGZ59103.1 MAG: hypothetical protein A3B96_03635 [Candidatus Spechtbacteria bacterium RIFCSPHIGHO2_02_FULL_43_15b]